jgi:hypothetical protein
MRHLVVLFMHFIAVLARLLGPGGVRSLIAGGLGASHSTAPFRNRSEAFDTAGPS